MYALGGTWPRWVALGSARTLFEKMRDMELSLVYVDTMKALVRRSSNSAANSSASAVGSGLVP